MYPPINYFNLHTQSNWKQNQENKENVTFDDIDDDLAVVFNKQLLSLCDYSLALIIKAFWYGW